MRCIPIKRAGLAFMLLIPVSVCAAQSLPAEGRTARISPESGGKDVSPQDSGDTAGKPNDQTPGALTLDTVSPGVLELDTVSLNIIDQKLALSLAVDTWAQIETGELALTTVRSDSLREVILDRLASLREFSSHLETLTGGRTGDAIAQAVREIERDAAGEKARVVSFRPLALNRNATAMVVRIRLEILQQYTELLQTEMAAAPAEQRDRQFLRGDLLHQMQLLAMLQVFEAQASSDFAEVIAHASSAARKHLESSRQLLSAWENPALVKSVAVPLAESAPRP